MLTARNAPCPCGSGRKFKQCCMRQVDECHRDQSTTIVSIGEKRFTYQGIVQELRHIRKCANDGDMHTITYGPLFFFSTDTGDAWLLDTEDHLAACVMRDYELVDITITPDLAIAWPGSYRIGDHQFHYDDANGKTTIYWGYPTAALMGEIHKTL